MSKQDSKAKPRAGAKREDIGDLLVRVLTHPDLPQPVYGGIVDGLNEITTTSEMFHNAETIRHIFKLHEESERRRREGAGR